jgi:hypothetical protein
LRALSVRRFVSWTADQIVRGFQDDFGNWEVSQYLGKCPESWLELTSKGQKGTDRHFVDVHSGAGFAGMWQFAGASLDDHCVAGILAGYGNYTPNSLTIAR